MLIAAEHVCKNYGLRQLLNDASLYVDSGDKIGIIGINGTGKSTLLRLLARTEEPDEGTVQRFPRVRAAYLAQNPEMDERATVLEQVLRSLPADAREAADYEARAMLMRLGIYDCIQRVGSLSGGRRKRAALAATLLQPADVLLLDEPTNDLDVETLTILEDYLEGFPGAVLAVTHDRYFLDKLAERIIEVREGGETCKYVGGFTEYQQKRRADAPVSKEKEKPKAAPRASAPNARPRFSYKEQREFETIDAEIEALTARQETLEMEIAAAGSDYVQLQKLLDEQQALAQTMEQKTERWIYLNELAEKIAAWGQ